MPREVDRTVELFGQLADDVVRCRVYLTRREDFAAVAPIFGQYFAKARPASTALVCGLVDEAMKIEIEVTATKSA